MAPPGLPTPLAPLPARHQLRAAATWRATENLDRYHHLATGILPVLQEFHDGSVPGETFEARLHGYMGTIGQFTRNKAADELSVVTGDE